MRRRNMSLGVVVALAIVALCALPAYAAIRGPVVVENFVDKYSYRVEINGIDTGQYVSVDGLAIVQEVVEYQNGDDPLLRKRPGRVSYAHITLTKQYASTSVLNDWIELARTGNGAYTRKTISVIMVDQQDNVLQRWNCFECFPVSWELTPLEGGFGNTLYEQLVVALEWFEEANPGNSMTNG